MLFRSDSARFQYLLTAPQLAFGKTRFLDLRGEGEGRISREGATLIPLHMRARRMIGQGAIPDGIFHNLALDGVLQLQGQTLTSNKMTLRAAKLRRQLVIPAALADRKCVVKGRGVSVRVDLGGRRISKNKKT